MFAHLVRIGGLTAVVVAATFYPFLPGAFDRASHTISTGAQVLTAGSLLLVPVGCLWAVHAVRSRVPRSRGATRGSGRRRLMTVTTIAAVLVVLLATLGALAGGSAALAVAGLSLTGVVGWRLGPWLDRSTPDAVALHLMVVPIAALSLHLALAGWATASSRQRAMDGAEPVIADIERHHAREGAYPSSLVGLHPDYTTGVVGIASYQYARHGSAYSLSFERPELLFPNFGTREVVVYNPRDEHLFPSHASWILMWPYETLVTRQGWYASFDAGRPHWRYVWFD